MWFWRIVIAIALVAVLAVAAVTLGDTERTGDFKDGVLQHVPLVDDAGENENERDEQGGEEREQAGDDDSKADERENENENENEQDEQEKDQKDAAGPLAAVSAVSGDGGDGGDDEDEPIDCSIPDNADDSGCDTEDSDDSEDDSGDSHDSTRPSRAAPGDSDAAMPLGGVDTGAGGSPRLRDADNGILGEINRVRARFGLRPLHRSARLERAATRRSRDMALRGYFSHTIPGTGVFWKSVLPSYKPPGYRWWLLGENLLWSALPRPASFVVRAWLNSPPHRRVLLRPSWNDAGIGALRTTSAPGVYGHRPVTIVTAEFGMLAR